MFVSPSSSSKPRFGPLLARDTDDLEVEASDDPEAFTLMFASPSLSKLRFGPLFTRDMDDLKVEASNDPETSVSMLVSFYIYFILQISIVTVFELANKIMLI